MSKKILILAAVLLIAIIGQGLLGRRQGDPSSTRPGSPPTDAPGDAALATVTQTRWPVENSGQGLLGVAKGTPPPLAPARRRQTRLARRPWPR